MQVWDVEPRALRTFVAVAQDATVTRAAAELDISQPAASRHLQQLEADLGLTLFRRDKGRLRPSAAAKALLPVAQAILRDLDAWHEAAATLRSGRLAEVRMAATGTTRDDVLAPWVAGWGAEAPMPDILEAPVGHLFDLLSGSADLVVSPAPAPRNLRSLVVGRLPVWAHMHPGHPLADRPAVGLAELCEQDLLLLTEDFHARHVLDVATEAGALVAHPVAEFSSPVMAQAVAATGRGIAVLTDDDRFGLTCRRILAEDGSPLQIRLTAAWRNDHHAAPELAGLARELRSFVDAKYPAVRPRPAH